MFQELKTEKALNGEHRIIDGYHSAYVLASFKDGFYDGGYKEYVDNILITVARIAETIEIVQAARIITTETKSHTT